MQWFCDWVQVPYVPEGLEAIIFTADGDMRQALNNLQVKCMPLLQNCCLLCTHCSPCMLRRVLQDVVIRQDICFAIHILVQQ